MEMCFLERLNKTTNDKKMNIEELSALRVQRLLELGENQLEQELLEKQLAQLRTEYNNLISNLIYLERDIHGYDQMQMQDNFKKNLEENLDN